MSAPDQVSNFAIISYHSCWSIPALQGTATDCCRVPRHCHSSRLYCVLHPTSLSTLWQFISLHAVFMGVTVAVVMTMIKSTNKIT